MIKDTKFYKMIILCWANGEIIWGLYPIFFDVHSKDYDIMMPVRVLLALLGYFMAYMIDKPRFDRFKQNALSLTALVLSTQMFYYAFQNYNDWKIMSGVIVALSVVVTFLPTIRSLILSSGIIILVSWFVPDATGEKYFFMNIVTYVNVMAIFKFYYIKRAEQLAKEKEKVKEQEHGLALCNFAKGISHELNNKMMSLNLKQQLITHKLEEGVDILDIKKEFSKIANIIKKIEDINDKLRILASQDKVESKQYSIRHLLSKLDITVPEGFIDTNILVNKKRFLLSLQNIIDNAKEAGASEIEVESKIVNDKYLLFIKNNGESICDSERIFEGFYTTKDVASNMGIGLSMTKHILDSYDFKIELSNSKNVEFLIEIPISNNTHG